MGLDGVELIMSVEEKFDISIRDDEAELIRSPQDLYRVIGTKLQVQSSEVCLTQRAFYLLRKTIREEHPISRKHFTPRTPLEQLVPKHRRREEWLLLRDRVGAATWPELKFPNAIVLLIFILGVCLWLTATLFAVRTLSFNAVEAIIVAAIIVSVMIYLTIAPLRNFRTSLQAQTVGSLSDYLVVTNPQLLTPSSDAWTKERIRAVTRAVIIEQLAISPNFDDNASFVDDLGVD